jgi:hypothetical protein
VCFAALDAPTKFKHPIYSVLSRGESTGRTYCSFRDKCDITTEDGCRSESCYFPILIHESMKDRCTFDGPHNQAYIASVGALIQQEYFGMRLPLYQIVLEGSLATILRCFWVEEDGVSRFYRTITYSPAWPNGHYFDLKRPAQMLECFLIVVNIMKCLPEVYGKAAFDFQSKVLSGRFQEAYRFNFLKFSDANLVSLMVSADE